MAHVFIKTFFLHPPVFRNILLCLETLINREYTVHAHALTRVQFYESEFLPWNEKYILKKVIAFFFFLISQLSHSLGYGIVNLQLWESESQDINSEYQEKKSALQDVH